MRISDWSSDVCSSDLVVLPHVVGFGVAGRLRRRGFDGDRFAGRHRNRGRAGTQAGLLEEIATTRIDLFLFTHGPPSFSRGDLGLCGLCGGRTWSRRFTATSDPPGKDGAKIGRAHV